MTPEEIAEKEEERKSRKKEIVMIVIGTFISLVLTQLLADILINVQRAQNRRMSAMMVLSNVENFARMLDGHSEAMARNDTVAMWLLTQPLAYLDTMPAEELDKLTNEALSLRFLNRDHTAENIFESSINTWDNMGNVKFIDMVGQCFSQMNSVEEFWNDWVTETKALGNEISGHSENYPGTTVPSKYLHNDEMRHRILRVHDWRGWMKYVAAFMRYLNKKNMEVIGITEEELMSFIKDLEEEKKGNGNPQSKPMANDYYTPLLNADSLFTMPPIVKID